MAQTPAAAAGPAQAPAIHFGKPGLILALLSLFVLGVVLVQLRSAIYEPAPIVYGFVSLAILLGAACVVEGSFNPLLVVVGDDGRLSTSKFQLFLWTAVVAFSYGWIWAARAQHHLFSPMGELPTNVLVAMGFSVATATAAKAIVTSKIAAGEIVQNVQDRSQAKTADLFEGEGSAPDLVKIQMLFWTVLAAMLYLITVSAAVDTFKTCTPATACNAIAFPDIDSALMALMGLGQGAYLGGKLTAGKPKEGNPAPQKS